MKIEETNVRRQMVLIGIVGTLLALAAIAWATGQFPLRDDAASRDEPSSLESSEPDVSAPASSEPPESAAPPVSVIEDCNRYAAAAKRDAGRVVGDAAVGGAIGAGVGAASGAIAGGDEGPKKGAGVGAIVGATAGTLFGLNEENKRTYAARSAYADCMARSGYAN
jgi:hypothetical protein